MTMSKVPVIENDNVNDTHAQQINVNDTQQTIEDVVVARVSLRHTHGHGHGHVNVGHAMARVRSYNPKYVPPTLL